ncbi:hypothetical protein BKA65DRAFT_103516 [Rhexocercosporidium sp. MPI-PUGE-AT-0058]|nr:hypothetical protein BKA65DRAFT_103516 [Rhexocercosporidium sp. MPI-PUGE-AT-0058]
MMKGWDALAAESRNLDINFAGKFSDRLKYYDPENHGRLAPLSVGIDIWLWRERRRDIIDRAIICGRTFFVTSKGYFGIGPGEVRVGDSIYILCGGPVPYVIRKREGDCTFVGECAIPCVMDGTFMDISESNRLEDLFIG